MFLNKFKKLFHNFGYKIGSLFLGVLLWYFVQGEEIVEINRKIQINFMTENNMAIRGSKFRTVDATIKGPRVLQSYYTDQSIEANIVIPRGKTGNQEYRIDKHLFQGWNSKLDIIVHDPVISVYVDRKETRTIPVRVITQGLPSSGLTLEKIDAKPNAVTITGPKSEIDRVSEILTEPVDISGAKQSENLESDLIVDPSKGISANPSKVMTIVQLGESRINKQFSSIPIFLEGGNQSTAFSPKFISIVLQGTKKTMDSISRKEIRAFLDVRDLPSGSHRRKIQVKIPQDTTLIETIPNEAVVEVQNSARR